ncbi:MAG: Rrf2 family transcriptional regulator [Candidatus Nealsonbacteria bacterium]|nr:Rrf2 family transcriptional regulator [Candidatus Nealsonbacteria bacterium]
MKISRRTQYGLRAMIHLAECFKEGEKICPLKEISDDRHIPFDYSEKILSRLQEKGLVEAKRGAQGGYFLARSPEKITVGEIISSLENTTTIVKCLSPEKSEEEECPRKGECKTVNVWRNIQKALNSTLNSITLADLI